jgi:hypothetical protein
MTAPDSLSALTGIGIGLGLAAACGFRVFLPLLVAGAAAHLGHLPLAPGFEWLGSTPALIAFGTATALEVGAYYVPWLDHTLDAIATPAAVLAGMMATASVRTELPPVLQWLVPIVAGGGTAGLLQGATVLFRLKSAALTGGIGNPAVSTAELLGAVLTSLLAILLPLACLVAVAGMVILAFGATGRLLFGRHSTPGPS